jgi:hypothetical protein
MNTEEQRLSWCVSIPNGLWLPRGCRRLLPAGFAFLLVLCALPRRAPAQGCVQSRGAGLGMLLQGEDSYLKPGQWQATVGYRWLHSDRQFCGIDEITGQQVGGGEENKSRNVVGDQVVNDSNFIDVTAT